LVPASAPRVSVEKCMAATSHRSLSFATVTGSSHTGFRRVTFGQNEQVSNSVGSEPLLTEQASSEANNPQTDSRQNQQNITPK
jgi:hypothetical protein